MPSKLEQMQLQLRQKLLQEKEEKLVKIYNTNQKKALDRLSKSSETVQRNREQLNSAPSLCLSKTSSTSIQVPSTSPRNLPIKQGSPGVDRSRPLAPIQKNRRNNFNNNPVSTSLISNGISVHPNTSKATICRINKKPQPRTEEYKRIQSEVKEVKLVAKTKEQQTEVEREKLAKKNAVENYNRPKVNKTVPSVQAVNNNKSTSKPSKPVHHLTPATNNRNNSTTVKKASSEVPPGFAICKICSRKFSDDRIEKHRSICMKVSQKKRKVFDATKMRVEGTEAETFVRRGKATREEAKPKKSNWRTQHESFLESIRQAKTVQKHLAAGGKLSDLPPPKPSENPDYVPCPHCGRKFNQAAAERHIPKCKNIASNKPRRK